MRQPTPDIDDLARRLLAQEGGGGQDSEEAVAAAEQVLRKLGEPVSLLVGRAGFHSLLARAVNLSASESPMLRGFEAERLQEDSLQGIRATLPGRDPAEVQEAMVSVVANFVWLLVTFIGRNLALRLVSDTWPELPAADDQPGPSEVDR